MFNVVRELPSGSTDLRKEASRHQLKRFRDGLVELLRQFSGESSAQVEMAITTEQGMVDVVHVICGFAGRVPAVATGSAFGDKQISPEVLDKLLRQDGVASSDAFCGRKNQLAELKAALTGLSPGRIELTGLGKTSLLNEVSRQLKPDNQVRVGFASLGEPEVQRQAGLFRLMANAWGLSRTPRNELDFYMLAKAASQNGGRLVMLLDDGDMFAELQREFDIRFFRTLRSAQTYGISIAIAVRTSLHDVCPRENPRHSPFHQRCHRIRLERFSAEESREFVDLRRFNIEPFTDAQIGRVLEFAQGHPDLLQIARIAAIRARQANEPIDIALAKARDVAIAGHPNLMREWASRPSREDGQALAS